MAAVGLDDALDDRQPETRASTRSTGCLPESIEDMGYLIGSDTASRILDMEPNLSGVCDCAERDASTGLGELDRIADKIVEDLDKAIAIRPDIWSIRWFVESQFDRGQRRERCFYRQHIAHDIEDIHAFRLGQKPICLQASNVKEILD